MKILWKQKLIALSQAANALVFNGYADETMSARSFRMQHRSRFWMRMRAAVDLIFWFDKDHCFVSYLREISRSHLPKEYTNGDN